MPPYDLMHDCFLLSQRQAEDGGRCLRFSSQNIHKIFLILFTQGEPRSPLANMPMGLNAIWEFREKQSSTSDLMNKKCWGWGAQPTLMSPLGSVRAPWRLWNSASYHTSCPRCPQRCVSGDLSCTSCREPSMCSLAKVYPAEGRSPLQLENTSQGTWQGLCPPHSYNRQAIDSSHFSKLFLLQKEDHCIIHYDSFHSLETSPSEVSWATVTGQVCTTGLRELHTYTT